MNIFEKNYESVRKCGKINQDTTEREFELKLHEELWEVANAVNFDNKADELGDLMLTCASYLLHFGYKPEEVIERMTEKNIKRLELHKMQTAIQFPEPEPEQHEQKTIF